ncbi:MAG TPA: hypothetical protein VN639_21065 [Azonexus sp.]|nr:hypothetical protein [Azonexus sp.]
MKWDRITDQWKQVTDSIEEPWSKLSDDHIAPADRQQEKFIGIIQEQYGITREAAEEQVREWDAMWAPLVQGAGSSIMPR